MTLEEKWRDAFPPLTGDYLRDSYLNVMQTTRQRWWQIWKPRLNAAEHAVIAAYEAELKDRLTCLYTGPVVSTCDHKGCQGKGVHLVYWTTKEGKPAAAKLCDEHVAAAEAAGAIKSKTVVDPDGQIVEERTTHK